MTVDFRAERNHVMELIDVFYVEIGGYQGLTAKNGEATRAKFYSRLEVMEILIW